MNDDIECWRPVEGWIGHYEVSSHGRIRSLPRTVIRTYSYGPSPQRVPGKLLTPTRAGKGRRYLLASLGRTQKVWLHHLVAVAFLGPRPFSSAEVCHNDNDGLNNRVDNLRWDTRASNARDRVRHGTHHWGCRETCSLGHPLVAPNLVPSERHRKDGRAGGRTCLACNRAHANRRHAEKRGRHFDFERVAHEHYRRIVTTQLPQQGESTPLG